MQYDANALPFLRGGGEMGVLMRAHDWAATPVGEPGGWPASLKALVGALLQCQLPMYIAWGEPLTQFYNDAYRPILGNKHPAALGRSARETWEEIWPTIGPMWREVLEGKPIGFDDFKLAIERFGYPEDCWFNFSYSPVQDDEGRHHGVMVTFAETTKRVLNEAALREETRLLEVLNRTGESLAGDLDIRSLLQRVTDAATELTGAEFGAFFYNGVADDGEAYLLYTLSGAPREAFESFGHPRPTPVFAPTFHGGPPIRVDDIRKDPRYGRWGPHHGMPKGHLPVCAYLAVSVISRSGEPIGGLFFGHSQPGVFTERSERLAVGIAGQAAVAVDNARLYEQSQKLAEERRQLLESEREARMEAERANSLKEDFLATLSHELRTPLSAITGWVHILRMKLAAGQPELLKGVDVIERSTKVQVQLIEDLLDISRIRAGKFVMDRQPVAPVVFVQAAIDMIRPALATSRVELVADLEGAGLVAGDAARLQQVVWNLLSNALKFTPAGGFIRVGVRQEGHAALVAVEDTGAGIRPEFLADIFERFRQADSSTTRKFGGLGLGLSIVRHIVEAHGGSVQAFSEGEGRGARFEVRLPMIEAIGAPVAAGAPLAGEAARLAGVKVLVVEDEPDMRELLANVLAEHGATVRTAETATRALEVLRDFTPQVLASDIGMPGMDGYQLLRTLRGSASPALRELPAIAMTAFARPEDRERARAAGFDVHLAKPLDPARVVQAIAELAREA